MSQGEFVRLVFVSFQLLAHHQLRPPSTGGFDGPPTPEEYLAGLTLAIERGWLELHDSGTFVKFTSAGADLFA